MNTHWREVIERAADTLQDLGAPLNAEELRHLAAPAAGKGVEDSAFAELIAADVEYDKANDAYRRIAIRNYGAAPVDIVDRAEAAEARRAKALEAALTRQPVAGGGWRCFHCDEPFTDTASAANHFGTRLEHRPACQIDAAEYRRMEALSERYFAEDAEVHRAMYRMQREHQVALRRAEESGYAKGLRDSGKCPCAAPTDTPADGGEG